jgi:hypothetical protein
LLIFEEKLKTLNETAKPEHSYFAPVNNLKNNNPFVMADDAYPFLDQNGKKMKEGKDNYKWMMFDI